ncbi:MAG: SPOR domain-containing protein [Bacteroidales bacterium]|nr:SPOR domain-containing protein [Bacteroidales bacterium]
MNKVRFIFVISVLALGVSSCDFFRHLAGRPDSREIAAKRAMIEKVEAFRDSVDRARLDSVARAEKYFADSLYALDTLSRASVLRGTSSLGRVSPDMLPGRYCIVAGAFANEGNAMRLAGRYEDSGFQVRLLKFRNGRSVVLVAPSDSIVETLDAYRRIGKLAFASKGMWIIVNE